MVIWDGQNESVTDETGKAIRAVRHLDLSNRPWENGWSEPQSPTDCVESHTYLFIRDWNGQGRFHLSELARMSGVPRLNGPQKRIPVPIILNEYAWLWLTRDGHPTCLTDKVLRAPARPELDGRAASVALCQIPGCRDGVLAMPSRMHRRAAILRPRLLAPGDKPRPEGGATSDRWIDLESLTWEPNFEKHVRDAFSPVGLMLDFWAEGLPAGAEQPFQVDVINDLEREWQGEVRLHVLQGGRRLSTRIVGGQVPGFGLGDSHDPPEHPCGPG